jgi:integrase
VKSKIILTDIAIRSIQAPASGVEEYPDGKLAGFALRVTKRGLKSFCYRYRSNGANRRLSLGHYPETSLSDARRRAEEARVLARKGSDPRSVFSPSMRPSREPSTASNELLFPDVLQTYLDRHCKAKLKPSTARESERLLRKVFEGAWRHKSVTQIKKADVIAITDSILDRGHPSAARHAHIAIRAFFNWCIRRDYVMVSPCSSLESPAPALTRERVLTEHEIRAVWDGAQIQGYPYGTIVQIALLTAQRRCEVAGMLWSELDLQKRLWFMPANRVKNGRPHAVPLAPQVVALLSRIVKFEATAVADDGGDQPGLITSRFHKHLMSRPSDYVFPSRSGLEGSYSGFSKGKRNLDVASATRGWTFHDLRRTAASGMAELGCEPHVIEKVINHRSGTFSGVAAVYNRFEYLEQKRAALELWARHVDSVVGPSLCDRGVIAPSSISAIVPISPIASQTVPPLE